ncbi:TrkH family potassium uptake protein [Veillonella montpellierensis]|uniref:TrkH family potassium uptake protein n=1 Tax=Veillonella montpellierensis TaxID=187328 RepID=UPI00041DBA12|nr:TrkH family potassium uptake protein [Veillonella montpellierensis]
MRIQIVMKLLGYLILIFSALLLVPFGYSIIFEVPYLSFLITAVLAGCIGGCLYYYGISSKAFSLRDGFLVVGATWVITSLLGALPFLLSGIIDTGVNALFESVSGITATGASIISNVDDLPKTFVLWRSLLHWMGGMGIIVLVLAFLKNLGADSAHLFNAEASVPRPGVVLPRIQSMAGKLWSIYVFFSVICAILLMLAGLSAFDAVNLAMSLVSTGGFAPNQNGAFLYTDNYLVRYIFIIFMVLAGGNFTVYYSVLKKGIKAVWNDFEYKMYLLILSLSISVIFISVYFQTNSTLFRAVNDSVFTLISMQTGSGFAVVDYDKWPPLAQTMLLLSTFFGGCSGSTTGGMKIIRIILLFKSGILYLRKAIHPDMVQTIRVNGKPMPEKWLAMTHQFFFLYLWVFALSILGMTATGISVGESIQCVAGLLGNVGLAFGEFGPTDSFESLSGVAKCIGIVDMLLGRLELFTFFVMFHPTFWEGYFTKTRTQRYKVVWKRRH